MYMRDQHSLGLLRRALCNLLPAVDFFGGLFAIQFDDTASGLHRNDFVCAKLDCFLYDQFHLIRFRQALEQINPAWELIIRLLRINDVKEHLVRLKSLDRTAVFTFAAVADPQFLSLFHTKDIGDMVHIGPCDMDLVRFLINLMRFYKKSLHEISPFLQLRRPIRPAL